MIALHGAGLTNMMFMPKGSIVYELRFENDFQNNCYYTLSSEFNHAYFYQLCTTEQEGQETHDGNVVVNTEEFAKNLTEIENLL
jgi:capsular polysaccharide biosynthesis protein